MTEGIPPVLVHPPVETGEIVESVFFFLSANVIIEFDGVCATAIEGVARIKWVLQGQSGDEVSNVHVGLFTGLPFAFPYLHDVVPTCNNPFVIDELTDVIHGPIQ